MQVHRTTAQFDLSLSVDLSLTHRATIEYNTDLFDADRIERLIGHYWELLGAAVADPGCLVGELALLSPSELAELQSGWAESVVEYDRDGCVDGLFEDQAARSPLAVAVRFEGSSFTFEELNRRANRLARHLVSLGAGAGTLVGIRLERSLDMVVALLAVLKAGSSVRPAGSGLSTGSPRVHAGGFGGGDRGHTVGAVVRRWSQRCRDPRVRRS